MNSKAKRLLSWLCVLALCMSLLPMTALAAGGNGTADATETTKVSQESNGVTVNKWVTQDEDGNYRLNMEAYASNVVTTESKTTPLDIVLVLDASGSMDERLSGGSWQYDEVYELNTHETYYIFIRGSVKQVNYSQKSHSWYYSSWGNRQTVVPKESAEDSAWNHVQFYTQTYVEEVTKWEALESAVNTFLNSVQTQNDAIEGTQNDHQVALIKFAGDKNNKVGNDIYPDGRYIYNYTQIVNNLTSDISSVKGNLSKISPAGATSADYGLEHAQSVLNQSREDAEKVVVFFTDGEPNHDSGFDGDVAEDAIEEAKDMKDDGVTIYTVGVFSGASTDINGESDRMNLYMHAISSNYPYATGYAFDDLGTRAHDSNYYFTAENAEGLNSVFQQIFEDIHSLQVYPDTEAELTDTLSKYFNFPDGISEKDVTAQYVLVNSGTGEFDENRSQDANVKVTFAEDTISITGFDYVENAVTEKTTVDGKTVYSGGKLVVSFPIELDINACRTDRTEDGLYPTNSIDTGTQAGLKYKENAQAEENTANTLLSESPKVAVDVFQTGEPIHINVYVDGDLQTSVGDWLRVTPVSDSSGAQASFDSSSDNVTYEYTYYNCKDIGFTAKEGYVIQGIDAKLVYGQSGCKGIYDPNTTETEKDNVGTLVADNVKNGTTVAVYLSTLYSAQFHRPDKGVEETVTDLVAYQEDLELNNPSEMEKGLRPEEGKSYTENGNTFTYVDVGDGSEDHAAVAENGQQEGHGYVYVAELENTVTMPTLPDVGEDFVANGWWLNDVDCDNAPDYTVDESYSVNAADADNNKIIHFYSSSAKKTGTVVINYQNEDGEPIKASVSEVGDVNEKYTFTIGNTSEDEIPFVIHYESGGTTTKYVFDHFTEDSADLIGTYTKEQREITAVYKVDSDGDNKDIPDEYIATVTYKVVNGTWEDTNDAEDKTENFVLRTFNTKTNTWEPVNPTLGDTIPAAQPNEDYLESSGAWYTGEEENYETVIISKDTPVTEDITYTYRYTTEKNPALEVYKTVVSVGGVEVSDQSAIPVAKVGDTILYKIEVKNTGNVPLNDISIQDSLNSAAQTLYTDVACATELSGYVSLDTNATGTYYVKYVVTAENAGNFLYNTAKATSGDVTCEDMVTVMVAQQYTLTVNYYYDSIDGANKFDPEGAPFTYTLNANDPWSVAIGGSSGTHIAPAEVDKDGTNYTFDRVASTSTLSGEITDDVVVNLVYSKDVIGGGEDLDTPDQIPDKYQVTIEYKAAEGGSIAEDALTKEVKTIYAADDTTYAESGTVTATGSTATAAEGYFFNKWTKAVNEYPAVDTNLPAETGSIDLGTVSGGDVITFTAYFTEKSYAVDVEKTLTSVGNTPITDGTTPPMAKVGDNIVWTITVTYWGNQPLEELTITDTMTGNPTGSVVLASGNTSDGVTVTIGGDQTSATVSGLDASGDTATITATYTVQDTDAGKDLNNTVIAAKGGDKVDEDTPDKPVTVENPALTVGKSASADTVQVGDTITYTVTVENTGNVVLNDVLVKDVMMTNAPTSVTFSDGTTVADVNENWTSGQYTIEKLGVGVTVTITYTYTTTEVGTVQNTAEVTTLDITSPDDDDTASTTTTVTEADAPSLDVTKTLTKVNGSDYTGGKVSVGDRLTYTIKVTNTGNVDLTNVTLTDTFNGVGDLTFSGDYTVTENDDGTYTINIGSLKAGNSVELTATYKVLRGDANGTLTNAVSVTGTPTDGGEPTTGGDTETTPVNPYRPPIRPPEDPDKPELNTEDHYAYIVGYEDGTVRPENNITRAEVATIFFRLLTDESRDEFWSQTNPYSDVSADDWYNNAVSTLTNAGILDGYEDGTFRPNGNITRAEFATITSRFFEATYEGEDLFPDIDGHWAKDYINESANAGIVNGYEDGTFRPQKLITRAEAVTMVNRTIERHPDADHLLDDMITWPDNPETAWYYEQIQEATNSHEYTMNTDDEQNPYEIWTKLLPNRDWSELEKEWSDANDGAGSGEVV